jgi:uroporphyrinogen decarboxylase
MYLELNESYFNTMKENLDIWFFGNDFGSQNGMLFSPDMWREFFYEPITELCNLAHSYGLKVMMHSCGSIIPIISELIEAGVDILDPIQVTASGMAPERLAREFGDKITFHGGIDTQRILPFGTVDQVTEHCHEVIGHLSSKGGYIASGSQILGSDIPIDNILTMYETFNGMNIRNGV